MRKRESREPHATKRREECGDGGEGGDGNGSGRGSCVSEKGFNVREYNITSKFFTLTRTADDIKKKEETIIEHHDLDYDVQNRTLMSLFIHTGMEKINYSNKYGNND